MTDPLDAMRRYPQFILWKPYFIPEKNKYTKVPWDYITNRKISAHDPANWMAWDDAERLAAEHTAGGVGFVLAESDPFFCVDLDAAYKDGEWSQFAIDILARFPGAAVETSYSGTGLHIFGCASVFPDHKNRAPGIEIYTRGQFIALGSQARGDVWLDHTAALQATINEFMPGARLDTSADWTDEPESEWSGPADDETLISRMLAQKSSAAQAMGGRASLPDLWNANVEKLAESYPPDGDSAYNASGADAALCASLAFWTGKDCERMDRLFRMSGLMREKWEREDYRQTTILNACGLTKRVYVDPRTNSPETAPAKIGTLEPGPARTGFQFLGQEQQLSFFKGCAYVIARNRVLTPDGSLLNQSQFGAVFGGYEFAMDSDNTAEKDAWAVFTRSRLVHYPKVHDICFRPKLPPGALIAEDGWSRVNTYVPIQTPRMQGDAAPFLDLMQRIIPNPRDREIVTSYMAAIVQYPGYKFQWCTLIQGAEGNGKTTLARCVAAAVGERYSHVVNADDVGNKFNAWVQGNLFAMVEEIYTKDRRDKSDALKPLITNDRVPIQPKGVDEMTGDNYANFMMFSNHEDGVVITIEGRRYCVIFCPQQRASDIIRDGMGDKYFPKLYEWLRADGYAIVSEFLHTYSIADEFNPAKNCHRAPKTSSTRQAIAASRGRIEQEVLEAIAEDTTGFRGGWVSSLVVSTLIERCKVRMAPQTRGRMLAGLGYVPHPLLPGGRASKVFIQEGAKRPILYIKEGSALFSETDPSRVVAAYEAAQGY